MVVFSVGDNCAVQAAGAIIRNPEESDVLTDAAFSFKRHWRTACFLWRETSVGTKSEFINSK